MREEKGVPGVRTGERGGAVCGGSPQVPGFTLCCLSGRGGGREKPGEGLSLDAGTTDGCMVTSGTVSSRNTWCLAVEIGNYTSSAEAMQWSFLCRNGRRD